MPRLRVLLAEDHRQMAEQLCRILKAEFDVVATVTDGYGLLGAARLLKPDVIVTDIAMPGLDGLAAAEILLREDPAARIVVVTAHNEHELVARAQGIGVMAYVVKSQCGQDLVPAVQAAARGAQYAAEN